MVDDKFQLCQIDVFVWQVGEVECVIWVVDVYYYFQWQIWYVVDVGVFDVEVEQFGVDIVGVVFGVGDGDILIFLNVIGSIVVVDYCWDFQFMGDNCCVIGMFVVVGDNC